ncbi:hypothetical protein ACFPVX_22930 [Cohnella faecalis]|uniref:Uncharacterized protein n=1 Tax=Cohnella faecalis TaxID=2315694 RepID=A0A398CJA2_9BACL|nr:hypothetical protein [Cohnella faecalis]RIE02425.1 hypothetical protein D3H35_17115 [Cohnella faecalis]
MWTEIAAFLKANTTETLLISIIGTILVWMYKQFKGMIDRKQQNELTIAQLKQGLFTKLELSIASVLHLDNEGSKQQMYALLGECGPYLTSTQRTVIRDYYKQFNPMLLHSLQALTVNEVEKLGRQLDKIRENEDSSEWFSYIMRLYAPFGPILLFVMITLYIVFVFSLVREGASLWIQICILLLGATVFVSATLFISMIVLFVRRELAKQGVKRWCAVALIIASPVLAFAVNRLDMSIIVLVIQILGLVMMSRFKRPSEIVRP